MAVEIHLRKDADTTMELPDRLVELEMRLDETNLTVAKLKESTDLLTEEFRKSESEHEAREYFEYIQENRMIIEEKSKLIESIMAKIHAIKGIPRKHEQSASPAQGQTEEGHYV